MLKNERKSNLEGKKVPVSDKVINLSDLLKPTSFKNNLQNNDKLKQNIPPFIRHNVKPDKLNYEKFQEKLKTMNNIKYNEKEDFSSNNNKNTIKSDKGTTGSSTIRSKCKNNENPDEFKINGDNFKKFLDQIERDTLKKLDEKMIQEGKAKLPDDKNNRKQSSNHFPNINLKLFSNNNQNIRAYSSNKSILDKTSTRPNSEYKYKRNGYTNNIIGKKITATNEYPNRPSSNSKMLLEESTNLILNDETNTDCVFRGRVDDYIIGKELGKGAYAIVKNAMHKQSNRKMAIKIYEKFRLTDPQRKSSVSREIVILKKIDHPSIVKLFEVIDSKKEVYYYIKKILLIMELVSGVSLLNFLKSKPNRRIDEKTCKEIYHQIIDGITFCHSKNIYHRDIKLENLILDENNRIKIIDFGFSANSPKNKYLSFFCGTPSYMPPEIVQKKDYLGHSADIWSCGILLYAMLCGSFPFRALSEKELYNKITKGIFVIPDYISDSAKRIIKRILIVEPQNRPSAQEILQDEWFKI